MELRQLRYVVAVVEHRHFRRAAQSLGMTQPSLSRQVGAVERELGTRLFERTARGVEPTAAGEVFAAHARRVLEQVEAGATEARRAARGQTGSLRLGFVGSALLELLPSLLARFRSSHPGVNLECRELSTGQSGAALLAGDIDLAICRGAPTGERAERLTAVPVSGDHLVAVCHRGHPFAGQPSVSLDQLRTQPLIATPAADEPATVRALRPLLDHARGVVHARDVHTAIGLAACGIGVGLLPSCARRLSRPETVVVEVDPPLRLPDLTMAFRTADNSPALGAFLSVTSAHCSGIAHRLTRLMPTEHQNGG
ncbi:LysR family transcriptional regulator [Streptoalloteichus hindustanus]|uniref:DNA-binding transcriptional regulator, LysR family n=1 Tax=Streptoalloteichus hindustanus TaxID=2017 RepID=A0A1M5FLV1_STRHI|nr:LysR family transcriptional regulator [Streptoalloteichus hindustanus]SHF92404.1 DNA-binding transcriptional regulator, LysR family [Streptoalloteichus hindustanus]